MVTTKTYYVTIDGAGGTTSVVISSDSILELWMDSGETLELFWLYLVSDLSKWSVDGTEH